MSDHDGDSRYCRCGTRLARDNDRGSCGPCQRQARNLGTGAPQVPAGFWDASDQLRDALDERHLGRVITAYRNHPHHPVALSQETVAGWMGITQTRLSRIESGDPITDLTKLIRWAEALRIPEDLLWFKLPRPRAGQPSRTGTEARSSAVPEFPGVAEAPGESSATPPVDQYRVIADVGEVVIVAIDRRTFLAGSGAGFLVGGKVMPLASYQQVAPEAIEHLAAQLDGYYRADAALGPHTVIPSVLVQQELIRQFLRVARGPERQALLRTSVAYAGLTTWLYQDAGDLATASQWANQALELAHRVGDTQLVRHALTNKAMICTDQQDGPGALDLTSAALADEDSLCAKVRVQAMQQTAHGYALIGDRRGADYALDKAAALLSRVDDDYPWFNACRRTPGYIEVQRATCYNRLGLGREALPLWEQVISALPTTARRDKGVYRARQATAHAQAGNPDAAADAVTHAVTVAQETSSARLRQELHGVWRHLTPWHDHETGRQVKALLATL
ncbi:transcriptional regulator [Frankia sp. CcI49]|uniref:helix-turn-helix domain-containing protein n=1 Tax=Frankia sp. CcI49 TaxID=1745382 RepID=UPI0009777787|nr:helix-turn-helix transcriptional regulator [Frankia sp. CcI49]ONH58806.1 transcriptional regulator [Frankia sp. CcI49]